MDKPQAPLGRFMTEAQARRALEAFSEKDFEKSMAAPPEPDDEEATRKAWEIFKARLDSRP